MLPRWINYTLTRREKYYLFGGIAFVAAFILVQFVISPLMEAKENTRRAVLVNEKALQEIRLLSAEYRMFQSDSGDMGSLLAARPKDFTLFSFLEKMAGEAGVKANIKYMKPSTSSDTGPYKESSVEMKLEDMTLEQLVEYLYLVESEKYLVMIKRISIKQGKGNTNYLTALIHFITYQA